MFKLDLTGQNALVTGVADDGGFAWQIAKSLKAAGAKVYLASHPRVVGIVERVLRRNLDAESRKLPYGVEGEFQPDGLFGCDVEFDTLADIPAELREAKAYRDADVSIDGAMKKYQELSGGAPLDILIHSVAFSPEIQKTHLEVSRKAYLTAMSISSYSLISLTRAAVPLMAGRQGKIVGLTYLAAERVVPGYGGGMAAAKAALECDARVLSWFVGEQGHRVNLISAGPYPSRAAKSIGDINVMINAAAAQSPLRRPITGEEVADTTLFLCSNMSSGITGDVLYVDCGYHVMTGMV
ncbi:SDR family oxidoreductase [Myxococcota bacterium]|nr:SDR family oxidoreductase [Myxococcota bacterium]